jgi:hypothetical protein
MTYTQWFLISITLQEAAGSVMYAIDADWRRAVIWACYALATLMITL